MNNHEELRAALSAVKFIERQGRTLTVVPEEQWDAACSPQAIRTLLADHDKWRQQAQYETEVTQAAMERVKELEAEMDALKAALAQVRPVIASDRQALLETHGNGIEIPATDELGTLGLYEYDGALHAIDAALAPENQGSKT